jgi:hypothetical protein
MRDDTVGDIDHQCEFMVLGKFAHPIPRFNCSESQFFLEQLFVWAPMLDNNHVYMEPTCAISTVIGGMISKIHKLELPGAGLPLKYVFRDDNNIHCEEDPKDSTLLNVCEIDCQSNVNEKNYFFSRFHFFSHDITFPKKPSLENLKLLEEHPPINGSYSCHVPLSALENSLLHKRFLIELDDFHSFYKLFNRQGSNYDGKAGSPSSSKFEAGWLVTTRWS